MQLLSTSQFPSKRGKKKTKNRKTKIIIIKQLSRGKCEGAELQSTTANYCSTSARLCPGSSPGAAWLSQSGIFVSPHAALLSQALIAPQGKAVSALFSSTSVQALTLQMQHQWIIRDKPCCLFKHLP